MRIGFTGTRNGMTDRQKRQLKEGIIFYQYSEGNFEFHHGGCIGSDEEAHDLAYNMNVKIVIHPPIDDKYAMEYEIYRDKNLDVEILPAKDYLDRNHDIVDACDLIIAAVETREEQLRSGTWATIRYARKHNKRLVILEP